MASGSDATRRVEHDSCATGKTGKNDTIYMNERVAQSETVTSNHLEVEASMLNNFVAFMRRYDGGVIYFDTPFRLHLLVSQNARRYAALIAKNGQSAIHDIARSIVALTHGGSVRRFHTVYRTGYIQHAERFRGLRHVVYSVVDAFAVPHIFCTPRFSAHDGGDDPEAHIVLFVAYLRQDPPSIVMYDSTLMTRDLVPVARCDENAVVDRYQALMKETRADMSHASRISHEGNAQLYTNALVKMFHQRDKQFSVRCAFHHIENFLGALEMVKKGLALGRDTMRHVPAPESEKAGAFHPKQFRFYRTGYGVHQHSLECGLFTMYGMNDLARHWKTPSRAHVMSSALRSQMSAREFFVTPRLSSEMYTYMVVADLVRKYIFNWRVFMNDAGTQKRDSVRSSIAAICQPQMRRHYDTLHHCIDAAWRYATRKPAHGATMVNFPWITSQDLERNEGLDCLIRIVDCESTGDKELAIYNAIARAFPYIRFLVTVVPHMCITVNYKRTADHRFFLPTPDHTYLYRADPDAPRMARESDVNTVRSVLWTTFSPQHSSRRDAFCIELPDRCDYVQWVSGVGWLPFMCDK